MRAITPIYSSPFSFFENLRDFEKDIDGLVEGISRRPDKASAFSSFGAFASKEKDDAWLLAFDLPGVDEEDLNIEFERGQLVIQARRAPLFPAEDGEEDAKGAVFKRALTVPDSIDAEKISAKLEKGVLTLTLPKTAEQRARKIPISVH